MTQNINFNRRDFPADFLFGTATSAYQVEGHQYGAAGETHWDSFAATPGNVVRSENGNIACDHYHRYESDLDLVRDAGFDSYRFSTSWARVLPQGRGKPNPAGLDFYDRLVDAMLARDLKPCATLYHWELPSALADLGGWRNPDIANWFADFSEIIMHRIGDRLFSVAPINEPWCVSWLSHFLGHHAPGLKDIRATARAMHHVLLAHGRSIQVMRAMGVKNLGAIFNMEWAEAASDSPADRNAAERYDGYYNRFFIQGVTQGNYPEVVLKGLEAYLPEGWDQDFEVISQPLDWCGLNYYTRSMISADDCSWPHLREASGPLPKTAIGWEIYPEGLSRFLKRIAEEYTGTLPLYITENGMACNDQVISGQVEDPDRIDFLNRHIAEVKRVMDDGVPVKGYYIWSLLDNYEWSLGYDKRFGLVHVNFDNLKRTPKQSYHQLQQALRRA
jgi:beta-glucosidase